MKKLLMIDPKFPTPRKSVNHQSILPHGLLKIGSYYKSIGWDVRLQRLIESEDPIDFEPNKIMITSIFTYWSEYVKDAVDWARRHYDAPIEVGGGYSPPCNRNYVRRLRDVIPYMLVSWKRLKIVSLIILY